MRTANRVVVLLMHWQNPVAWIGLLALALPVLIHLFSKRQTRVVPFPSLQFFTPSRLLPTRRTRLSDVPLLVVRMAIIAAAVTALAAPLLRRSATAVASNSSVANASANAASTPLAVYAKGARVIIVDTTGRRVDTVQTSNGTDALTDRVAQLSVNNTASVVVYTDTPHAVLFGAVSWLSAHAMPHEIVVLSDFRPAALDSLDLAALPANTTVRLERLPVSASTIAIAPSSVMWYRSVPTDANSTTNPAKGGDIVNAIRRTVLARGGTRLVGADSTAEFTGTRVLNTSDRHDIVVVSTEPNAEENADANAGAGAGAGAAADSLAAWLRTATPLSAPWMGNVVAMLHKDTVLAVAARSVTAVSDTVFAPPLVVVLRSATRTPLVAAAAIADSGRASRLLLVSRVSLSTPLNVDAAFNTTIQQHSLFTAALLLSASNALTPHSAARGAADTVPSARAIDDATLRQWEQAPSSALQPARTGATADVYAGQSDGRYLWIMVMALLVIETIMRRRYVAGRSAGDHADANADGNAYGGANGGANGRHAVTGEASSESSSAQVT